MPGYEKYYTWKLERRKLWREQNLLQICRFRRSMREWRFLPHFLDNYEHLFLGLALEAQKFYEHLTLPISVTTQGDPLLLYPVANS